MITLSYRRFGDGIYISHTDVLRSLNRTMRRANIDVAYSLGFHKHMNLKLTQPLPLGVASDDEWVTADVADGLSKQTFFDSFKENCPPFLEPTAVYYTRTSPSLAARVVASEYEIFCKDAERYAEEIKGLKDGFSVTVERNGESREKDFTGYVYGIETVEEGIICTFAFGNKNLRVDLFLRALKERLGLEIPLSKVKRTRQLVELNGGLVSASEYVGSLE